MSRMVVVLLLLVTSVLSRPSTSAVQHVLGESGATSNSDNLRSLKGRFLHITDIHPDPYYRVGSEPDGEHPCHRGDGRAGYFGAEMTSCDSPISLVNATFDWIKHNIKNDIDFVIWTGDSARHDNDELYPRTSKEVEQLNDLVVAKFDEVFGKPDNKHDNNPTNDFIIPIVPTFGNNDILPHNIFTPGPNKWTKKYLSIWKKFVPQEQRHSFARGGWFFTEVIPNKLAVFSLNTMYFFESNAAVDGCYEPSEPGYEHFEWLRIQLQFLRERGMKAILMGHVPPARTDSKQSWDETCYQKYNLWLRQYRDVIVGNIYGHMNIDHFVLHDVRELSYKFKIPGIDQRLRGKIPPSRNQFSTEAKSDYLADLRSIWSNLPAPPRGLSYHSVENNLTGQTQRKNKKKEKEKLDKFFKDIGGPFGERFSLSVISPSVVPNFFPTLRIVEYNITGLENDHPASAPTAQSYQETYYDEETGPGNTVSDLWSYIENFGFDQNPVSEVTRRKKHKKKKRPKKPKPNFIIPDPPSTTAVPGPGYSPQTLTLLSWKQLFANLTKINQQAASEHSLSSVREMESNGTLHEQVLKRNFAFELEYDTRDDKVYNLKDLTIRSWLGIAEKIGRTVYNPQNADDGDEVIDPKEDKRQEKGKKRKGQTLKQNHLWHAFLKRAFVGAKSDEELEDEFG